MLCSSSSNLCSRALARFDFAADRLWWRWCSRGEVCATDKYPEAAPRSFFLFVCLFLVVVGDGADATAVVLAAVVCCAC